MGTFSNPKDDLGRGTAKEQFYTITIKTACGCKQTQIQPEYVVKDMEFIHLPIRRPVPVLPGPNIQTVTEWRFRTFKCSYVDTINHTALYEEYLP